MIRLPPYTLVDLLHETAGAVVYRGVRDEDCAVVTVKLLAGDSGSRALERLRNEYVILKSIDAPSVVRPIALEQHEGAIALVLQGLSGVPLNALLGSRKLDVMAVLEIGAELARALAAVHAAGIVHRDIKPANVIVDLDSRVVKLIDFGIATRLAGGVAPVAAAGLEGSLAYVSPEQTGRIDRGTDARSDLYSLGVTLYEMLVGAVPFASGDPAEVLHAHLTMTPSPPCAIAPEVPALVSSIVMKLLEKAPEARYQSAAGLLFDLERCLAELRRAGAIAPFVLGSRDLRVELFSLQRLYGREAERAALDAAVERVAKGARELVLVQGPSGIGKSALVREIAPKVVACGGHLVSGKCDQKGRSAPYAPVVEALRELFERIATGSEAERERFRGELCAALGSNAPLLADLVPELALVIGPQDHASEVEPVQAQNRLAVALGSAIRVLSASEHPLVIFLDDLQWADPGTAWLLRVLVGDEAVSHMLLIGALRDGELPDGHPLALALAALGERAAAITTLRLGPLGLPDLRRFVADALGAQDEQVADLAQGLFARTGGNPFFTYRLVRALHEGAAITFDPERNLLVTDRERLEAAWHGGSVVELLAGEIDKLAAETRHLLVLAAAVGHVFDRQILSQLTGKPETDIDATLLPAIREGHVLPVGRPQPEAAAAESGWAGQGVYRFAHDRLEQAAFSLAAEPTRRKHALEIGRILLARASESGRDEDLFDAADHLNEGAPLLLTAHERAALAQTHLHAGRRARARAAFETAAKYFRAGVALLDDNSFERDPDLSFALHSELAECEAAQGEQAPVLVRLELLDGHARTLLSRARVATIRVNLYVLLGQFPKAVEAAAAALRAFGLELPDDEQARSAALQDVLARAGVDLAARPPASRLAAPDMTDPEALANEKLLVALSVPAYFVAPALLGVVMIAWLDLVTAHGHSDLSAMGYVSYGFFLSFFPERQKDAYEIGKLALALNENRKNRSLLCKVMETFAGNIAFLHEPLRSVLARFPVALAAGLESGDFVHAAYICDHTVVMRLGIGDPLEAIGEQAGEFLPLIERTHDVFSTAIMRIVKQVVANLMGRTIGRASLSDGTFDEREIESLIAGEGFGNLAALYRTLRLMLLVVHGAWPEALAEALLAEEKSAYAAGQFFFTELTFYAALARIRADRESARQSPVLARHMEHLRAWAALCPPNYLHKHLLVLAELARIDGDELRAMKLYEEAIEAARENELVRDEALASELSAEFHRERGRSRISRAYATDAHRGYLAWGATAKALDMQHGEYGIFLRQEANVGSLSPFSPAPASPITLTNTAGEKVSAWLDLSAIIRAAQAIASEIFLPRVIERLLRIVAKSAGAERGHLLLERDGAWMIVARIGPQGVETGLDMPLDSATDLAASVVRHVARTNEPVLLADAARDTRFGLDAYVVAQKPKSIWCLTMAQKGRRAGVVYLENNAIRGAFGKDRGEAIGILLTQAAIALEIGRLYDRVEAASEALRRANAHLEGEVARRTQQLQHELAVRAEAERERAILTEQVMRAQEERIAELSAPLLPIADGVLVMPLIGGVDAARATRVLEAALASAGGSQAKAVIIDITGVKSAGAEVAAGLLRTARALRLLGAEAVITGVRAEVARALVEAEANLSGLVTKSTLKAGIAHAIRKRG